MNPVRCLCLAASLLSATWTCQLEADVDQRELNLKSQRVFARFELGRPRTGPFPSDIFTVKDVKNITGRRLNYPLPNCRARPSDCDDLEVVNTFDGWGLEQQVSIPFTGNVDPETVSSDSVFLISLSSELSGYSPTGALIGINQIVWDPAHEPPRVCRVAALSQSSRGVDRPRCTGADRGSVRFRWRHGDPSRAGAVLRGSARWPPPGDAQLHSVTQLRGS